MRIASRPVVAARPASAARPAAAAAPASAPQAKAAVVRPAVMPKAQAAPESKAGTIGLAAGGLAGAATGWFFGSVLAAGGLSGLLPIGLAVGAGALMAAGGKAIAGWVTGASPKPTWTQGIVGGAAGTVAGLGVWGLTAFAGGMGMAPAVFAASFPMGLATLVLGGAAVASLIPGRK